MIRRDVLKTLGLGVFGGGVSREAHAARTHQAGTRAAGQRPNLTVGPLDLAALEIIDTHVHPPERMTLSASYDKWNSSFVDSMVPDYDFPGKVPLREKITRDFVSQIWDLPRQTGYNNYMAATYGVPPTLEGFDSVVAKHIKTDSDFNAYIGSILDREKIPVVVLQSADPAPSRPRSHVPGDRFVWTYPIVPMIHPDWAQAKSATSVDDVLGHVDETIETAASNNCVGFKSATAYFRPFALDNVDKRHADAALKSLLRAKPAGRVAQNAPYYNDAALDAALKTYQDYLLKHIFVKAGQVERPIILHTAVALHPALRFEYNNPLGLYEVFQDDDIQKAATQFVLIHTGYPSHHTVASMISQFPNVFTDMSFYSKFPGVLEETYRAFLSLAPSTKVMHGSDSNNVPEEIGYCASNTRRVLARVLNDFRTHYGWTDADCSAIARNVMSENARRVFRIKT
jgi:hypothetical protein